MGSERVGEVVLVDDAGRPVGAAAKASVHGRTTPLHLAFSCHVVDREGRVLITRRSLQKATWPGVWSNSFCGHPQPAEAVTAAVRRHAEHELGLELSDIALALPRFRYRAIDASGVVENEICPVYTATTDSVVVPRPDEVMEHAWVDPLDLGRSVRLTPWAFSPWLVLQAAQLTMLGGTSPDPAPAVRGDLEAVR